ncbi:hypothetical protein CBR_g17157 [Chara braunii]|uniref:VPS10 domain-containing protein n=1 Tax=Chara braunii TaxID=69332 RepID=A0A388KUU6_CHABU|nr:hypothetical protein CBR_g17157 [Chara braunii]|eukprot:GBG73819.1 hypothetical protein CBR_g17157 [Chara braunii]
MVKGPAGHLGLVTIRMHPEEPDWILVMARRWSCWARDSDNQYCADDLFLTQDFGRTWRNLTEESQGRILSFVDFDWGWNKKMPGRSGLPTYTKETILAAVYEAREDVEKHFRSTGPTSGGWDKFVDFVHSNDFFKTHFTKSVPCGNQFEIMDGKLFLAVADQCDQSTKGKPGGVKLKISEDYGKTFTDACFPEPLTERGYSVVHVHNSSVFVNVDYSENVQGTHFGSMYVSDSNFTLFSLSMRRTARSSGSAVDFSSIQKHTRTGNFEDGEMRLRSKITFNNGGRWEYLKAPGVDSEKKPISCRLEDGCSLHLHGPTSWEGMSDLPGFAFVYSHTSTPGIVMSTGNVGQYLYENKEVNTYLSRDGAQTWEEVAKGPHIYEFGDQGGVIIMAKHHLQGSTPVIKYSLDEGLTWGNVSTGEEIKVYNIRVEPDNVGKKFIVEGGVSELFGLLEQATLVTLDFSTGYEHYTHCTEADYETWSPSEQHCLLGLNYTMWRQKRTSVCWNGPDYKRPEPSAAPCNCQPDDYACDFGMEFDQATAKCQVINGFRRDMCPLVNNGYYTYSKSNQRIVPGDMCRNPADIGKYRSTPPRSRHAFFSSLGTVVASCLLVLVILFGAVLFMAYRGYLPEGVLEQVPPLLRFRYQNLRGNFQSLTDDFGLGDEDEREMR